MAKEKKVKPLDFRLYIGDLEHPIENLSPEELDRFKSQTAERVGQALNFHFAQHMDEYERI